jgi:tetratricopeptide (TPR) repeat protein
VNLSSLPAALLGAALPADATVLAELPTGARHSDAPNLALVRTRLDVALPLAQFYIGRARASGDLRFLGYAEAVLAPWHDRENAPAAVLVLHATILQSRHAFDAALAELDLALARRPDDPQAWLTRATVLRVLGRYAEAEESCRRLGATADAAIGSLCSESLRGLTGHLAGAYAALRAIPVQALAPEAKVWRCSELGEMAERLGDDVAAERWFRDGIAAAPEDFYLRAALADLLLRRGRGAEVLPLLAGDESMEPMLLRLTLAHQQLGDAANGAGRAWLADAFDVEQRRGDAVHRREQARYLLDVEHSPAEALRVALLDWQVQREPDDAWVLLRAAAAAHDRNAAAPVLQFLRLHGLEDARLTALRGELQ